jgi:hypothetical protein
MITSLYVSYIVLPVGADTPVQAEPRRYGAPLVRIGQGVDTVRLELPRDLSDRRAFLARLVQVFATLSAEPDPIASVTG